MIFGENLLALLVLAIGAALAFGYLMALIRPRPRDQVGDDELERPPLGRSLAMITLGLLASVWALASLASADSADDTSQPMASVVVVTSPR
jgi:hypothetical protein